MTDDLAAAFAAVEALTDTWSAGALLHLERLPPSHAIGGGRCLGRWAWRARFCRILSDWVVAEAVADQPADAIRAALDRLGRWPVGAPRSTDPGVTKALEGMA